MVENFSFQSKLPQLDANEMKELESEVANYREKLKNKVENCRRLEQGLD